ncbi:hypothetical protein GCM10028820_21900 [Tessaracoccus terricola]
MDTTAHLLAEELVATDHLARLARARRIMLVAELATNYDVTVDDVMPVLADRGVKLGAGAPEVSEYVSLEVAGLLGISTNAAAGLIADAVSLRHRHPGMYRDMMDLELDPDRALAAARKCHDLPAEVAEEVTRKWLKVQHRHGWTGAMNQLAKLIINLDPEAAAKRERKERTQLGVHVWGLFQGTMNLTGRLAVLDAHQLDAAVQQFAELLRSQHPDETLEVLRAKALGVLANPAQALAMLQREAQPELFEDENGCLGHLCGTITTPLHKLRPRIGIAVHLHVDALGKLEGAARVEKAGHVTVATLAEALKGIDVTVRPVIDLNDVPAEDQYVPSDSLRTAVGLAAPNELFPFSSRATGLDLDHTVAFKRANGPGQTRLGNLAPLSRRAHRAKTAGLWKVEQPDSMLMLYESPLGYRYSVHPRKGTRRVVESPSAKWRRLAREQKPMTMAELRGRLPRVPEELLARMRSGRAVKRGRAGHGG